jgi:hypothetical protein
MHALHLPPGHLLRATLLAALAALAIMALLAVPAGDLTADRGPAARPATAEAIAGPPVTRPARAEQPRWLTDPLAPPALHQPSGR